MPSRSMPARFSPTATRSLPGLAVGALAIVAGFAAAWFLLRERLVLGLAATLVSAAAVVALAFVVLRSATEAALSL